MGMTIVKCTIWALLTENYQWGSYMFSFEPPSGTGYEWYLNLLKIFQ